MRTKALLAFTFALFIFAFLSCDDDLSSVGLSIRPDGDEIDVGTDTLIIKAETVSFKDSVYARTIYGMLGEYIDPIFGKIKSDYLCEFYCPEDHGFVDNVISIDSVFLRTQFTTFMGDSIAPMGVSIYEVTSPLKPFFFTSTDPTKYCDMKNVLGQSMFSIQDLQDTIYSGITIRSLATRLDLNLGKKLYQEWIDSDGKTFENTDELKKFFKGVYVTTTFGSGTLISTDLTDFTIYYTANIKNVAETADSAVVRTFRLEVNSGVIQMNRISNSIPESLYTDKDTKTYLKTPAGLYTQINIPLREIMKNGTNKSINAANLTIKGYTEEEEKYKYTRPDYLFVINKDSLHNFFFNNKKPDYVTNFIVQRSTYVYNAYNLGYNSYAEGNLTSAINHYVKHYKDKAITEVPEYLNYLLIPVSVGTTSSGALSGVYNIMAPTSAILRTDEDNMKMSIIYSQYDINKK